MRFKQYLNQVKMRLKRYLNQVWNWCINHLIIVIPSLFVVVFTLVAIASFKKDGDNGENYKSSTSSPTAQEVAESKQTDPVIPCMCNESDLVFHHAVSDVRLSKNEKYTWKRPHGYEVRWCAYGGKSGSEKVEQLTRNNQPEMTLQALEDNVLVMVRYYVKKH